MAQTDLPISLIQAAKIQQWFVDNYEDILSQVTEASPFDPNHVAAIACQESGDDLIKWINVYPPESICGRCITDASGDVNGDRTAFPVNTPAFAAAYPDLAPMLIAEGNLSREWRGYSKPQQWVYCAWGIFSYDIQAIRAAPYGYGDLAFWANKQWYDVFECTKRLLIELEAKYTITNDVWKAIQAYNGAGAASEVYVANVQAFYNSFQS